MSDLLKKREFWREMFFAVFAIGGWWAIIHFDFVSKMDIILSAVVLSAMIVSVPIFFRYVSWRKKQPDITQERGPIFQERSRKWLVIMMFGMVAGSITLMFTFVLAPKISLGVRNLLVLISAAFVFIGFGAIYPMSANSHLQEACARR